MLPFLSAVSLLWNANTETNLFGYKVHQGGSSRFYTNSQFIGGATSNRVQNLTSGSTYYFAVTALVTSGAESDYSNEVQWQEPQHASTTQVSMALCPPDGVSLSFATILGERYVLESTLTLDLPWFGWVERMQTTGTGQTMELSVAAANPKEFFRVVTL